MITARDLPKRASRVGELIPLSSLHPAVRAWSARRPRSECWCVALSGGADSVALLLVLWANWPGRRHQLVALHFNHRMRGRASSSDAIFCRQLCRALEVPLKSGAWQAAPREGASEAAAREARHEFFSREMEKLKCTALWLAHQQDDIAETLLMRLARGSGTGGLSAPRPVARLGRRTHLRPLLTLSKAQLLEALRNAGAAWREDASNAAPTYFRNRIRQQVLPVWSSVAGRDALAGAALSRERLEEDDAALEAWLDEIKPMIGRSTLDLTRLEGCPIALWRRSLHRWLLAVHPCTDLSRQGFDALLGLIMSGRNTRFSLGVSDFAVVRKGKLILERSHKRSELSQKFLRRTI